MRKDSSKKTRIGRIIRRNFGAWLFLLPAVLVLYLMVWRPTVMGGVWSFFGMRGYTPTQFVGFKNYIAVILDTQFLPTLLNTVKYVLWSLVIGFLPPVIAAVAVNEMVHFKKGFRIIMYLPAVVPAIAAMLMWYYIYYPDQSGLLNMFLNHMGLASYTWLNDERFTILFIVITMTWSGFPATMLLYYSAVQSVSAELYEAAVIDGAGIWKRVWHVTRPQLSGIVLLNFVRQIIGVFQVMEQPLAMTGGGPNNASLSLGFQIYQYGFVSNRAGHAMALSVVMFLILILFTCFYFRINKRIEDNY